MDQTEAQTQVEQRVWPDERELQTLGRVIHSASAFEHSLRQTFCALIGSKYAAVIVGAEQAGSLIEKCKLLTKAQREISETQMDQICELLNKCKEVSQERNKLVHDMWAFGPGAATHQLARERLVTVATR